MTLIDHIHELRVRLFVSVIVLVIAGIGVYFLYEPILTILTLPLGAPLYYTSPSGSFTFIMAICFMGALAVTIPVLVYNLIMFIRPAFKKAISRTSIYTTSFASGVLAAIGALFAFTVIIPGALRFFAGFQVDELSALISADSYLSFVTNVIITFILMFQIPLLLIFIDKIKPLSPKSLFGAEKWVVLGSLVVSFLVPFALDITTSLLIALPIILLYNISIAIILIRHAYIKRKTLRALTALSSKLDLKAMPVSTMSLDMLSYETLVDDVPIIATRHATPQLPLQNSGRPGWDIRPLQSRPKPVKPAEWVHRVHEPIEISPKAHFISDIRRPHTAS